MTRTIRLAALAAVVLAAAAITARAETPSNPKTYVVLVGVGTFGDSAINARPTAENDAKDLYKLITASEYLGADVANVRLLLGTEEKSLKSEPATKENIVKAVKWAADTAGKDDMIIVGLFGQGAPTGDRSCFFTKASTVKDRLKDAVGAGELESAMEKAKSEKILAFVDINYKGFTPEKNSVVEPNLLDMVRVFVGNEDKEEHTLPPGRTIFMASNNVAKHVDTETNGIFTKALIDGLKGKADVEGYEPDGVVTVDELREYLDKEVPAMARALGKTREEKEQAPLIWGSRAAHFTITKNAAVFPKTQERLAKLAKVDLTKDVLEEGTQLIRRMPKLKAQQELRKNFVRLADGTEDLKAFADARAKILAGMKLDKEDAEAFAGKTLRGLEAVKRFYVKELDLGEMVGWAVKGMYRSLEEKVPTELKTQLEGVKNLNRGQLSDLLTDARERLGKREDLENNKDVDTSLRTALYSLDPYTTYFDKDQVRTMDSSILGRFTGVGIQIRRDMARDGLLCVTPIRNSPAYRAGIKAGDLITEITRYVDDDGKPYDTPQVISTKGMKTDDAVKKILGVPNTKVSLKIVREGADKPITLDLTRSRIDVETVLGVKRNADDSWDYMVDPKNKIAYIRLTQFAPKSTEDMLDAVRELQKAGIRGLVLDLRFNPGGLLTSAVEISDMFIDDGLIVTVKPRSGVGDEDAYYKRSKEKFTSFPMVCMVNGMSASGSEILAACLQDQTRAVILGERSYGKGSVQNMLPFEPTKGRIKLTIATFWRPNGKNLNKASTAGKDDEDWGVRPDAGYTVPLARGERDALYEQMRDNEIIPNREAKPTKEPKPVVTDKQLDDALKYLRSQLKASK